MAEVSIPLHSPSLLDDLPVALIYLDRDLQSLGGNDAWQALEQDVPPDEAGSWLAICDERDRAGMLDLLQEVIASGGTATLEVRGRSIDQWIELRASTVEGQGHEELVVAALDVTAQKEREAMLTFAALRDPLTGLHNRAALGQHLQAALDRLNRRPSILAVLFIDLDGFGEVNEAYGHAAGDRALVIAAQQLRLAIRPSDLLARVGGDEFVAVCDSLDSAEEALGVARRLAGSLDKPIGVSPTEEHQLSTTIGVVFAAGPTEEVAVLLARADVAMYAAKQQGRGRIQVHAPESGILELVPTTPKRERLDDVVERLSHVEGELAEGWASSLLQSDHERIRQWRTACHYVDLAIASLRGATSPRSQATEPTQSRTGPGLGEQEREEPPEAAPD